MLVHLIFYTGSSMVIIAQEFVFADLIQWSALHQCGELQISSPPNHCKSWTYLVTAAERLGSQGFDAIRQLIQGIGLAWMTFGQL